MDIDFAIESAAGGFIKRLPSWIHMVFLLVYWVRYFPELVDGIMEMKKFKKTHTLHRHAE